MLDSAAADWRSTAPYAVLARCDRALLAWEWLRRDRAFRLAALGGDDRDAARFGLLCFEQPELGAPHTRPFWRADIDPGVLTAIAAPSDGPNALDLGCLARLATVRSDADGEHWLLSDGCQALRLDITAGTLLAGPVHLRWRMAGIEGLEPQLDALRRLILLRRLGRFGVPTQPTRERARRWATLLRVHDALLDGASPREIAAVFYGSETAGPRWRVRSAPWRLRVQRLVAAARRLAAAGSGTFLN